MVVVSWNGDCIDIGFVLDVENVVGEQLDKLNRLKPVNVEKEVRTIKKIIMKPNRVYGHGLIYVKDFEKLMERVERMERDMREIKIHLNLHDNMDLLENNG